MWRIWFLLELFFGTLATGLIFNLADRIFPSSLEEDVEAQIAEAKRETLTELRSLICDSKIAKTHKEKLLSQINEMERCISDSY